jgi:hypothetical protein
VLMNVRCEDAEGKPEGCGGEWGSAEAKTL